MFAEGLFFDGTIEAKRQPRPTAARGSARRRKPLASRFPDTERPAASTAGATSFEWQWTRGRYFFNVRKNATTSSGGPASVLIGFILPLPSVMTFARSASL